MSAIETIIDGYAVLTDNSPYVDEARAELATLLEYVEHRTTCSLLVQINYKNTRCTCGLDEFLKRFVEKVDRDNE